MPSLPLHGLLFPPRKPQFPWKDTACRSGKWLRSRSERGGPILSRTLSKPLFSRMLMATCIGLLIAGGSIGIGIGNAKEYVVGPGGMLSEIQEVPWESLEPGDVVSIQYREEPYRSKWVLCCRGTEARPIVVRGIPGPDGQLPVIDGRDAVTRPQLNYWNEVRGILKIGGANRPADRMPAHLVVESLEFRSARPPYQFTGRSGIGEYSKNAAAIFIEKGEHITIRNCTLRDCGNGLFSARDSSQVLVERCRILENGIEGSIYEHNNYTNSQGLTFQFNFFGPLRDGAPGNNLKDRSSGLVVRYNWIEGGNRALDLVDSQLHAEPEGMGAAPTFVYGNVLIQRAEPGNNQIVHYGGDSQRGEQYRRGILHFYHNTVVSERPGRTVLIRLSSSDQRADCRNNIVWTTAPGRQLAILTGGGTVELGANWLKEGWQSSFSPEQGTVRRTGRILTGSTPGFVDSANRDYRLMTESPCVGVGGVLHADAVDLHPPDYQYRPHARGTRRSASEALALGALEAVSDATTDERTP